MAETNKPQVSEEDKPFADWIGKIIAGKIQQPSALQQRLQNLAASHQGVVADARKAEEALAAARGQLARFEGAAELLYELLRGEFKAQPEAEAPKAIEPPKA